jgi:hypothetical protein
MHANGGRPTSRTQARSETLLHISAAERWSKVWHTHISRLSSLIQRYRDSAAWAHPCETRIAMMPQFLTVSIWYTAWYHMSFENCHKKPNAGAWTRTRKLGSSDCFVIPDPSSPDDKKLLGTCFVLDRVPVGLRCA